ncbi:hypothetical protein L2E82_36104 [Cichorium intybus]|uniref:Uncharacterized protein n=1 Tax=Cichorium intybus TaxID=13427 RepID=A0ACB9BQQ8_CICIN|nr:hypothetical protein L2E82_36104 [Cichorium intybus]
MASVIFKTSSTPSSANTRLLHLIPHCFLMVPPSTTIRQPQLVPMSTSNTINLKTYDLLQSVPPTSAFNTIGASVKTKLSIDASPNIQQTHHQPS